MHEEHKLQEARYFLEKMRRAELEPAEFSYELSAFLSAARSVLQYALDDAETRTGGQQWYDSQVSSYSDVRYFRDKRNISIHVEPVTPQQDIAIEETVQFGISESIRIEVRKTDGTIVRDKVIETQPQESVDALPTTITVKFMFKDWPGSESVVDLCLTYLKNIENIVADGVSKGFIQG